MLTIFEKIEKGFIDLANTNNDKTLIMAYLKQAYNEGVEDRKEEVKGNLLDVYKAIDIFLENGDRRT